MDEQLNFAPCGYLSLDDDGKILSINETLLRALDYTRDEVEGHHISRILSSAASSFYQLYFFPMIRLQDKIEEMYTSVKTKAGDEIPIMLNAIRCESDGKMRNNCVCIPVKQRFEFEQTLLSVKRETDKINKMKENKIAELDYIRSELESKQQELLDVNEKLQELADTDGLTGLFNRRSLEENLTSNVALHAEKLQPLSFILIDIDYFKNINDNFGHMTGDRILQELGGLLQEESRLTDFAARYGGEEFALILPNTDKFAATKIGERIRSQVENANWARPKITVSIGISTSSLGDTKSVLQLSADRALYASKNGGRNQVTHASDM